MEREDSNMSFNGDLYPTAGADVVMTTSGDMVKYQSGARARLGIGSANQLLQVKSSLPSWETVDLADTVLTTQGDVLYENASGLARLGFGTSGDVLTTKGTGANPVWETPSGVSLSDNNTWTGIQTFNKNIEPSGGIAIKPIITRTFDYLALDDTVDPFVLSNVVGTNTDDGVITGVDNGRQVTTGTGSGAAGSLHPVPKNYDPVNLVVYGLAKRNDATCNIWLGAFSQLDQGGDMVAYLDGTQATYKSMVIRQHDWGQLIAPTDVAIDTNWTSFKIISDGDPAQTMYLLVGGVWTAKATNTVVGYAPDDPMFAEFYINNDATTNAVSGQFSRIRIENLS